MIKTETELRQDIVEVGRLVFQKGWVAANDGNISIRMDQDRMLCTPTGVCKGMMQPDDLIVCDMQGNKLYGVKERTYGNRHAPAGVRHAARHPRGGARAPAGGHRLCRGRQAAQPGAAAGSDYRAGLRAAGRLRPARNAGTAGADEGDRAPSTTRC